MQVYRVSDAEAIPCDGGVSYLGTMAEAHAEAKRRFESYWSRNRARIDLFDVPTDKPGMLALLTGGDSYVRSLPVSRTWGLTPRSGLVELKAEE